MNLFTFLYHNHFMLFFSTTNILHYMFKSYICKFYIYKWFPIISLVVPHNLSVMGIHPSVMQISKMPGSWEGRLEWSSALFKGKASGCILHKLACNVFHYHTLRARNLRIHKSRSYSVFKIAHAAKYSCEI